MRDHQGIKLVRRNEFPRERAARFVIITLYVCCIESKVDARYMESGPIYFEASSFSREKSRRPERIGEVFAGRDGIKTEEGLEIRV